MKPIFCRLTVYIYSLIILLIIQSVNYAQWNVDIKAMTSIGDKLYIIGNKNLWEFNTQTNTICLISKQENLNQLVADPIAMTSSNGKVYIIENQRLLEFNPADRELSQKGGQTWTNPPIAMTSCNNKVYVIENKKLWEIASDGGFTQKGTDNTWVNPPIAMTSVGDKLYVIENSKLWEVEPTTGGFSQKGDQIWTVPPIAMTAWDNQICIFACGKYHAVNTNGSYAMRGIKYWIALPLICATTSDLTSVYVIEGNILYKVNRSSGNCKQICIEYCN